MLFEEEEFVTKEFIDRQWNKNTKKAVFDWTRRISGLDGDQQQIIDQTTGEEPKEIQRKTLILLAPDEMWEGGCVALKRKKTKKFPMWCQKRKSIYTGQH
jgi:hypothetical protein